MISVELKNFYAFLNDLSMTPQNVKRFLQARTTWEICDETINSTPRSMQLSIRNFIFATSVWLMYSTFIIHFDSANVDLVHVCI